jgi:hypothetical protein
LVAADLESSYLTLDELSPYPNISKYSLSILKRGKYVYPEVADESLGCAALWPPQERHEVNESWTTT